MSIFSTSNTEKYWKMVFMFFLLFMTGLFFRQATGQPVTTCDNSNFNLGTFKGWKGCYGRYMMPCATPGFLTTPKPPSSLKPLHKLIQAPGWMDWNTCNLLPTIFPGEEFVARLGDTSYSSETDKEAEMSYTVTVTNKTYLFIYRYAVVLQTGGHSGQDKQPDFQVMLTNDEGTVLDSTCGYYYITAQLNGPPVEGWNLCNNAYNGAVYWKDWTTVGMDLTAYYGQTVNIVFKVRPCSYNTHFGYAYISAYCGYLVLQTALCEGQDSATLTGPPGFEYLWSTGDTTQSISVPAVQGAVYHCTLTAANGCSVTISVNLSYTVIHTGFTHGNACVGVPVQFTDTTWVSQNYVEDWKWDFGDGDTVSGVEAPMHSYDTAGTYTVRLISYSTEGCSDTAEQTITVAQVPHVTTSLLQDTLCSNDSPNLNLTADLPGTLFTWTATASSPLVTGYTNNPIPTTVLNETLINTGAQTDTVFYSISPHSGTCTGPDSVIRVPVKPLPTLTDTTLVKSICDSTFTNLIPMRYPDNTRFTWTCTASSANLAGYTDNLSAPDTLINQRLTNSGVSIDTVYYHLVPWIYGCQGDTTVYKVAVYPDPDISNTPLSKSICNNASTEVTLTSNVSGTLFTWTCTPSSGNVTGWANNATPTNALNQPLTVTGDDIQTVTYHITPKLGSCTGNVADFVVTVYPTLKLTNSPLIKSQCDSTNTLLALVPNLAGTLFTWTCTPSDPSITGYSNNIVPDDSINQLLRNSSYLIQQVTYAITPHNNGCPGPVSNFIVKVNPVPDLSNTPPAKAICDNTSPNMTLTSHVATTQFTWTCTPSSGNITGFSNNAVPTTTLNQTLDNTGYNIETVTYHLTPIANGCYGPVKDFTVTVYPTADLSNFPPSKPICDSTNTNITLTSHVTGTQFTWTCTPSSGNVTGWANNAVPTITLDQTLNNTGYNVETVTYHVLPAANLCNGTLTDFVVTVYPTPNLSNTPPYKGICQGQNTNLNLTSNVAGTQFTWTCTQISGDITGFSPNPGPPSTLINQTLLLSSVVKDSVIYHLTPSANGCFGPVQDYKVYVNPVPSILTMPLYDSVCSGTPTNIHLVATCEGTSMVWDASLRDGNVTGFSDGAGDWIIQTLTNHLNTIGSVEYLITPSTSTCSGPPALFIVYVKPTPHLTNTDLDTAICNNMPFLLNMTSDVAGASFNWTCTPSSADITGWSNSASPATSINQTLSNSGDITGTVTYHITPVALDCNGPTVDYVVSVYPTAYLTNSPPSKDQCDNTATNVNLTSNVSGTQFTWTCTASSANITGFSDNAIPTTLLNQTLDNIGYDIETVTYHITPSSNNCDGAFTNYTVTVYPTADLSNFPLSKPICDSTNTNITLTSHVTGTQFTWTCTTSSGNVTGWANNAVPTITLDQTLNNTGYNIETVTYHILPVANLCNGEPAEFVVTVNPTANLSNDPPSKAQCDNQPTNITLTSDVAGTQFTWTCTPSSANVTGWSDNALPTTTLDQTLDNIGFDIETVTYHITAAANNCQGLTTEYTVTVNPTATVTNDPLSQEQCDELNTNVILTSDVAGTQYTWTCSPSSANITGWSNQPTLTGSILQTLDNTGYNTETVNYHLTPSANNCTGTPADYLITVYPTPDLSNAPATQEQCDSVATNITLTSHVAGTQFTWTCIPSSANITGYADNSIPATLLDQTLDNIGYNIETVTYRLTPSAHNCDGPDTNYVVTINPTPDLSNSPPASQICDSATLNLTLTSHVTGTLFTWTCTPSSANITGWSNNAVPTTALNQTLNNLGLNVENVVYHMIPAAHFCNGPVTEYTVTVVQSPDVLFDPAAQTICSGETSAIDISSSVPGTTFNWTVVSSSPNLTGQSAGSGPLIAQTITNSGNTIEHLTYTVTPEAWGCPPGPSRNIVLTVNPRPIVNNSTTTFPICSAASTNIIPTSSVPGSTFAWTASGSSANVTGFSDGAGPSIVQSLTNTGYYIEAVTYQITATANSCPGNATPFVVTVFPVADVVFTPNGQTFCSGQTTGINISSHVAGTSYTWTATGSGASLSGYSAGSGDLIQQTLTNSGPYPQTATYLVSPTANACPGTNNSVVVTVNPYPAVTLSLCTDPVVSFNAQSITLKGGTPLGGTYSGAGVASGIFDPSSAGAGSHMITYNYVNSWLCSSSAVDSITVVAIPAFSCGNPLTDIRDGQTYSTVKIGTQCWFADNLNYGNSLRAEVMQRDNCIAEKYCFNDNIVNCTSLGGMYQWDELMKYEAKDGAQGLCPPEWHVPTETDWANLFNFYVSNGFAGSPLKYTGYSGFDAFLLGTRFNNVQWDFSTFAIMFWSSTSHGPKKAWAHGMNEFNPSVSYYPSHRDNAFFTRCIKD